MGIIKKFKRGVKKYMAEADQRAEKRLARARTEAEREKVKAQIQRERLATRKQVTEAKTALLKAEAQQKKAVKEIRDIGGGRGMPGSNVVSRAMRNLFTVDKPTRRKARRKVSRRK